MVVPYRNQHFRAQTCALVNYTRFLKYRQYIVAVSRRKHETKREKTVAFVATFLGDDNRHPVQNKMNAFIKRLTSVNRAL
jgi:hypothetical protein